LSKGGVLVELTVSMTEHKKARSEKESMTQHQGRHFLQIPGPSPVPDRVLRAMDMPVIDHRSAEFAGLGKAVFEGCQKIFKTAGPVIIFPPRVPAPGKRRSSIRCRRATRS